LAPAVHDDLVEGHLERLRRDQQPDGGWAITWQPPSTASTMAFRAVETLRAQRVLPRRRMNLCGLRGRAR